MDFVCLSQTTYLAIAASTIIFFLLGSLWFSALFGSLWSEELKRNNVVIEKPSQNVLYTKMALTFACNLLISIVLACLVYMTGSTTLLSGLILGLKVALGIVLPVVGMVFIWENKSWRLFLIDAGYPAVGIVIGTILLSLWR